MSDALEREIADKAAVLPDIGWQPTALLLIDRNGDCLAASRGAADMLHMPCDRMLGAGWMSPFHEADANIRWIASMTSVQGGSPALDLRTSSTQPRSFRLSFKPVPDHEGVLSVCVTETTTERAADTSSVHLKTLLDRVQALSATGYWRYDIATGRVAWSDRVFEIHGMEPSSGIVDVESSIEAYHPDDREQVREGLAHTIATGEPFEWELRILRKDGSIRYVVARGELESNGTAEDGKKRLFGVFQDVTEERERALVSQISQERLKLVVQASRDGVWDWRFGSNQVFFSNRLKEILGIDEAGNLMPIDRARSFIHPEDVEAYSALVRQHLEDGSRCDGEIRVGREGGNYRWVQVKAVAAFDESGEASRIVGTVGDITARKQADEVLRQARLDAVEASEAKSGFVATVSHELRTPLNGVIGMLDLLANSSLTADQIPLAETAADSARSLLAILDDLLDFSKLGAKRIELNPVVFDPREHLQNVINLFTPVAAKKNLSLTMTIDDDLPEALEADQQRLRQILANLVGNAVKFTREGSVAIRAEMLKANGGSTQIRYSVADTGIGISEDEQDTLFQPYAQAGRSTSQKFGGTGLGLAICKQLAECMGGSIGLDSRPGEGSTFWFIIDAKSVSTNSIDTAPMAIDEQASAAAPAVSKSLQEYDRKPAVEPAATTSAPDAGEAAEAAPKPHLLIAEDNAVNQRVITAMVSRLGYTFDIVDDGVAAVEAVRAKSYDAVLMDIQMPRLDGVMATRLIREEERDRGGCLPIVAITAHAMRGTREDYVAAGMTDFIPKPIEVKTLAVTLKRLCNSAGGGGEDTDSQPMAARGA